MRERLFRIELRSAARGVDVDLLAGEVRDQVLASIGAIGAAADNRDHVIDMIERKPVAFQNVFAVFRFRQQERGPAAHHVDAVFDEVADRLHQAHFFRLVIGDGQEDHAEALLHLRVLVELVEHDLRFGAALQFDDDAHTVAIGLIANVADVVDDLIVGEFGDTLDHARLVHLVGNFGDHDGLPPAADVFDSGLSTHHETAAPSLVGVDDAALAVNEAAGGEIRSLHELHHFRQASLGIVHQSDGGVDDLSQIVRRDVGRHAHSDTVRAIHDQVRVTRRQNDRLGRGVVEVLDEIDRVLLDVRHHLFGHRHQAALGVPIGCGRIAIDGAEVALPIDQRIAHAPWLRQAHQRVVDGAITVRVILLQTFADHTSALHVLAVVEHAHVLHGVENAAMHGLEPVANFRQRAADDDRHRIVEIRPAHLLFNVDRLDVRRARTLSVAAQGKLWIFWFVCHRKEALGFQLLAVSYSVIQL